MPMVAWWLLAMPLLAGALLPLQAGINGQVARHLASVSNAALISFAVGTLALLCFSFIQREVPSVNHLRGITWWHWSSGLLGVFIIATATIAAPRIGASLFMALLLAGQMVMALLLDHFGWAGFRQASASASKVGGVALIFAGIWLIRRG